MEPLSHFFRSSPTENLPWRLLRIFNGLVFLYAGAAKVADPQEFTLAIDHFRLTPWPVTVGLAFYLPWFELALGGMFLSGKLLRGTSLLSLFSSLLFLAAILSAWSRNLDISCGCFGPSTNYTNYPSHLAFNLLLLASTATQAGYQFYRQPPAEP